MVAAAARPTGAGDHARRGRLQDRVGLRLSEGARRHGFGETLLERLLTLGLRRVLLLGLDLLQGSTGVDVESDGDGDGSGAKAAAGTAIPRPSTAALVPTSANFLRTDIAMLFSNRVVWFFAKADPAHCPCPMGIL